MDCNRRRHVLVAVAAASLLLGESLVAQTRRATEMTDIEQRQYLKSSLDAEFTESVVDQLGLLALNRPDLVIPELIRRIEAETKNPQLSERTVKIMGGLIAYPANPQSIDGIAHLCQLDSARFEFLLARAFSYATEAKNPYDLAYYAISKHSNLERATMTWVGESLRYPGSAKKWAQAIVQRYGGRPSPNELGSDPLAFRAGGLPVGVRIELEALSLPRRDPQ